MEYSNSRISVSFDQTIMKIGAYLRHFKSSIQRHQDCSILTTFFKFTFFTWKLPGQVKNRFQNKNGQLMSHTVYYQNTWTENEKCGPKILKIIFGHCVHNVGWAIFHLISTNAASYLHRSKGWHLLIIML